MNALVNMPILPNKFRDKVIANTGAAVIMAGSDSDEKKIAELHEALGKKGIPHVTYIASAHKQGRVVTGLIEDLNTLQGSYAIIAIAGGTDALSGTTSFHAFAPTISSPPDHPNESCRFNPPGSPNIYIPDPSDTANFVARMYSGFNPEFREELHKKVPEGESLTYNFPFLNRLKEGKGGVAILVKETRGSELEKMALDLNQAIRKTGIPSDVIPYIDSDPDRMIPTFYALDSAQSPLLCVSVTQDELNMQSEEIAHGINAPVIEYNPERINAVNLGSMSSFGYAHLRRTSDVAKFAAQMFAGINDAASAFLAESISSKIEKLEDKGRKINEQYRGGC